MDKEGQTGKWICGHKDPEWFETTPHERIQSTILPKLPNGLQDCLNKAFTACFSIPEQESANGETVRKESILAVESWVKNGNEKMNLIFNQVL